jgi:hypothetical protein
MTRHVPAVGEALLRNDRSPSSLTVPSGTSRRGEHMKSVVRYAIFSVLVLMLPVGPSYSADSLTIMFRFTDTSGAAVRTFVPGEFNNWESPFSALSGEEDVFGLELNPQFSVQLNPGASADFTFSLRHSQSTSSGAASTVSLPRRFELFQNYPNPFNPSTTIRYSLPTRSSVTLTVFNTLGQKVQSLVEGERGAGYHEATLDGTNLSSGVYLYRLSTGTYMEMRKLLLLR